MRTRPLLGLLSTLALAACGGNECKLEDPKSCAAGLVCEKVTGKDKPACFAPVQVQGTVKDLATAAALANADVAALNLDGAPLGPLATSGSDGTYTLNVPSVRSDEKGTPVAVKLTLRAGATGYANFPSGLRVSLPLDTGAAVRAADGKPWVLKTAQTDVALDKLADAMQGRPSVSGTVESGGAATLVAVEGNGEVHTAVADSSGAFRVFNVPAGGGQKVQGYTKGLNYTALSIDVQSGANATGLSLKKSTQAAGTLQGSVQLVAGANGAGTSVVVVLESTFKEAFGRGEALPGLRAPEGTAAPSVTGAWTIAGVPDGKYVVLAAFENDGNVRDPDPNISGTQVAHVTVAGGVPSANPVFKVTGAVEMVGPGASGEVELVTGSPLFQWKPYSSAKTYGLKVYDTFGTELWSQPLILDVKNAQGNVEQAYGGPTLKAGQVYAWRVTARGNQLNPISQTEELRGLFGVK